MNELIFDVELDEGGRLLAIGRGQSIFTDGADWDDLKHNIDEVVEAFYFDKPRPGRRETAHGARRSACPRMRLPRDVSGE